MCRTLPFFVSFRVSYHSHLHHFHWGFKLPSISLDISRYRGLHLRFLSTVDLLLISTVDARFFNHKFERDYEACLQFYLCIHLKYYDLKPCFSLLYHSCNRFKRLPATDLRGSVSLVLTGLVVEGVIEIRGITKILMPSFGF